MRDDIDAALYEKTSGESFCSIVPINPSFPVVLQESLKLDLGCCSVPNVVQQIHILWDVRVYIILLYSATLS